MFLRHIRGLAHISARPVCGTLAPSPYDLMAETVHIGAFDGEVVVGCASVFPEAHEDEPLAWRLRGMAVDPSRQGQGIGRLVLEAAVEVVTSVRRSGRPRFIRDRSSGSEPNGRKKLCLGVRPVRRAIS